MIEIYFAQVGETGPIKIGRTQIDVKKRIAALQCGCPWPIRLLATKTATSFDVERGLFFQFSPYRLSGEWFLPDKMLLDFIGSIERPGFVWPEGRSTSSRKSRKDIDAENVESPYQPVEPLFRYNMLALANSYAKFMKLKLETVSGKFYGDSRFLSTMKIMQRYGHVKGRHVSFTAKKYDDVIYKFCKEWPDGAIFPDLYIDRRIPTSTTAKTMLRRLRPQK